MHQNPFPLPHSTRSNPSKLILVFSCFVVGFNVVSKRWDTEDNNNDNGISGGGIVHPTPPSQFTLLNSNTLQSIHQIVTLYFVVGFSAGSIIWDDEDKSNDNGYLGDIVQSTLCYSTSSIKTLPCNFRIML